MKYFVVVLCFAVICSVFAVSDQLKQTIEKLSIVCVGEVGLTGEEFQGIRTDRQNAVTDPRAQNFGKCLLNKFGFLNDQGDFLENLAIETLSKGDDRVKTEQLVRDCSRVIGPNKDENPIKLYGCYLEKLARNE